MTIKKISLEAFVRKYSCANQTEYEVVQAAVTKLSPESEGYRLAKKTLDAWIELEEYLDSAGFEI